MLSYSPHQHFPTMWPQKRSSVEGRPRRIVPSTRSSPGESETCSLSHSGTDTPNWSRLKFAVQPLYDRPSSSESGVSSAKVRARLNAVCLESSKPSVSIDITVERRNHNQKAFIESSRVGCEWIVEHRQNLLVFNRERRCHGVCVVCMHTPVFTRS
jgi:hypothetical protein